jgi:hypothetical protein
LETQHQLDLFYINASFHRSRRFTPIIILLITNRKQRSLTPYSKIEEPIRGRHRFANKLGTVTSPRAPKFCCPPITDETKRGSLEARSGYRITTRGVFRGERRTKTETEQEQSNAGEFPQTLTPSASIDITHNLELEMQLSLSLAQHFLFNTLFVLQIEPISHAFLSFFSRCTMPDCLNISFSIYEFNYLHRNLTLPPIEELNSTTDFDSNVVVDRCQ